MTMEETTQDIQNRIAEKLAFIQAMKTLVSGMESLSSAMMSTTDATSKFKE